MESQARGIQEDGDKKSTSGKKGQSKLTLAKSMKTVLATRFDMSPKDIDTVVNEAMDNANSDTDSDSSSSDESKD